MKGFSTKEYLDAQRWHLGEHSFELYKESKLGIYLRAFRSNQLTTHPSDKEVTRMYREYQVRNELREKNKIYQKTPQGLKGVVSYVLDLSNTLRIKSEVDNMERKDRIVEGVILGLGMRDNC
jgi:hypothetical protein|tara:strand:+ start:429 stop:794 length:366 start_codon:yes stop_codon:yes gene_type:complete